MSSINDRNLALQRSWLEKDGSTEVIVSDIIFTVRLFQEWVRWVIEVISSSQKEAKVSDDVKKSILSILSVFHWVLLNWVEYKVFDLRESK